ncbi:N-6 DNA methylase [Spiroplasma endosymbiont of Cantharis rufa]|uniref:N-6 DNA methylase n=1 Tax=Spiroplasma endosymbiont of Cantharis rufa TaxID=3066279 RepID=UPI0030D48002
MYRIDRNNYYDESKNSTVYTPTILSDFLFKILNKEIDKKSYIFDPCVGKGSLLKPWKKNGWKIVGMDIEKQGFLNTKVKNYLEINFNKDLKNIKPSLVIMNPPFNVDNETIDYIKANKYGNGSARPFLPEVWLDKTIELFGKDIPIVMFTPYGFRLNLKSANGGSKRYKKFKDGKIPKITSIISLPVDVYKEVKFHSEIIIFNVEGINPHYMF